MTQLGKSTLKANININFSRKFNDLVKKILIQLSIFYACALKTIHLCRFLKVIYNSAKAINYIHIHEKHSKLFLYEFYDLIAIQLKNHPTVTILSC